MPSVQRTVAKENGEGGVTASAVVVAPSEETTD